MSDEGRPEAVTVYWRPGCFFCSRLLRSLERAGVRMARRNIWEDEDARRIVQAHNGGDETVPTVVVGPLAWTNPDARTVTDAVRRSYPELLDAGSPKSMPGSFVGGSGGERAAGQDSRAANHHMDETQEPGDGDRSGGDGTSDRTASGSWPPPPAAGGPWSSPAGDPPPRASAGGFPPPPGGPPTPGGPPASGFPPAPGMPVGSSSPPSGPWGAPAAGGPVAGGPIGGGPYGGGPYGGGPSGAGPGGPPGGHGSYWTPQPPRRSSISVAVTAILVAVAVVAGIGIGTSLPHSSDSTSAGTVPSSGTGTGGGSSATTPGGSTDGGTGAGGPTDVSAIAARVDPGLVDIDTELSYQQEAAAGTGIVLTSGGLVLTNNHVINGSTEVQATDLGDKKVYKVDVVGYDETSDVAVVQLVGASGLTVANLAGSGSASVGQQVVAIGNAGGKGGTPTAAGGAVTALSQSITASDAGDGTSEKLHGLIETNADVQPGDSGGSLVDTKGSVIGMDTAASEGFSFSGAGTEGFAIPISTALGLAEQIMAGKASSVIHIGDTAFLGVEYGLAPGGQGLADTVEKVIPGTAADQAGIAAGDVITGFGGKSIASPGALTKALVTYRPGERVSVSWRTPAGRSETQQATLTKGPNA